MKITTMAWLLTGGFILGGMGVAACSSSSGGNPSNPPDGGAGGGGGGSVAGGGGGAAGGGSTDGGSTCSTPPKLYGKSTGQYCPFSGTPTVLCNSPGQGCCETPINDAGAISTCVATTGGGGGAGGGGGTAGNDAGSDGGDDGGGEGGAAGGGGTGGGGGSTGPVTLNCPYPGSTPWICQGTADCSSGETCCSVPQGVPEYDNTCLYYFWSHFAGTQCETGSTCGASETQVCYTTAECPTGKTCTASKAKGNDFGFCM